MRPRNENMDCFRDLNGLLFSKHLDMAQTFEFGYDKLAGRDVADSQSHSSPSIIQNLDFRLFYLPLQYW